MSGIDRPVVAGVDGSADSLGAARWAADEAVRGRRRLEIIHVNRIPGVFDRAPADDELAGRVAVEARRWQPGLHVTTCTLRGGPAALLIERTGHAGLIVVGGRGAGGFRALPVGSVSGQLAAHARCPVLVVHGAARWAGAAPLPVDRPVVVGTDGSEHAHHALDMGFAEAASRNVGLVAVRAWQPARRHAGATGYRLGRDVERALRAELEPWEAKYPAVPVEARAVEGTPAAVLVAAAGGALMVVLGPRGRGGFGELRLGSVTQQVVDHAPAPVLVVRD